MEKNKVYNILRRLAEHTVPSKYRPIIRNWIISSKDIPEKETAMRQIWLETKAEADENTRQSFHATLQKIHHTDHPAVRISLRTRLLRYAAILIIPIITGTAAWWLTKNEYAEPEMIECYVPNGKQESIQLPDGSVIQVNSGSLLIYPREFSKKKRSVYLSGEANFTVAKNPDKPFIVSTGPLKVEVLGTKFNIESYPDNDRITTTLEHGSVKIYKNEAPEKSIIMKPDEQVIYNSQDETFSIDWVEASDCSAWTQGELKFTNQPLHEILTTMERKYNVQIKLSPEISTSDLFTMKFKQHETIEDAMYIFAQLAGNINYKIEGKEILLFKAGKEVARK